ncbi:MAG: LacI family DNA-binding transcriptional regulator [Sphaerochaetaceae bacterium]|nr:LacI family DNA-binding transcriptional regulator [uncultured Sphaerochaeta sp.]MDC7228752.1 LacI family DNA-binding transcriptional regulator [Sphaerochaetaceae bacterium]
MGLTFSDIANEIGVSTATISRVVNNDSSVREETRLKVEQALAEHGYQYRARRKSTKKSNISSVMIIAGQLSNPITVAYINGIREGLKNTSYKVFVVFTDYDTKHEVDYLQYAKDNAFAGIFMLNVIENESLIRMLNSIESPVILVNRYLRSKDTDIVTVDNYRCGFLSTQYLINQGHTHIAHIAGPSNSITCQNRTLGYIDAMNEYKLTVKNTEIFYGDRTYQSGFAFGLTFAKIKPSERPTAVFSISGTMAEGFADAVIQQGLSIPDDVSLICNDDSSKEYVRKLKITCVEPNIVAIGAAATELFLERVKNPKSQLRRIVYPPVLTENGSVKKLLQQDNKEATPTV